jgi:uncharacterized paraquat-inducible protein A
MPKTLCPDCLTYCRVRAGQYGRKVICPGCHSKFVAVQLPRRRPSRIAVAIAVLALVAVGLFVGYKLTKPKFVAGPSVDRFA